MSRPRSQVMRARNLRAFPREVADLIVWVVTTQDVRWRMPDGRHVFLYPPDGATRPFKVSASRPAQASCKYIREQFLQPHHLEQP